jgi:hypothetical protein
MVFEMITDEENEMIFTMKKYGNVVIHRDSDGIIGKCILLGDKWDHSGYGNDPDTPPIMETYLVLDTIMWDTVNEL